MHPETTLSQESKGMRPGELTCVEVEVHAQPLVIRLHHTGNQLADGKELHLVPPPGSNCPRLAQCAGADWDSPQASRAPFQPVGGTTACRMAGFRLRCASSCGGLHAAKSHSSLSADQSRHATCLTLSSAS